MLTFLTLCLLAIVVLPIVGVALIGALVGGIVWIVLFPIRLLFRMLFGVVGIALGLLFMPVLLYVRRDRRGRGAHRRRACGAGPAPAAGRGRPDWLGDLQRRQPPAVASNLIRSARRRW